MTFLGMVYSVILKSLAPIVRLIHFWQYDLKNKEAGYLCFALNPISEYCFCFFLWTVRSNLFSHVFGYGF